MEQLAPASVGRWGTWGKGWREDGPKQVDQGLGNVLAEVAVGGSWMVIHTLRQHCRFSGLVRASVLFYRVNKISSKKKKKRSVTGPPELLIEKAEYLVLEGELSGNKLAGLSVRQTSVQIPTLPVTVSKFPSIFRLNFFHS